MVSLQCERLEIKDNKQNLTYYSKETIKRVNIIIVLVLTVFFSMFETVLENKNSFDSLTKKRLELKESIGIEVKDIYNPSNLTSTEVDQKESK